MVAGRLSMAYRHIGLELNRALRFLKLSYWGAWVA